MTQAERDARFVEEAFHKWWTNHTIDFDKPFTPTEKVVARAAFEAALRLVGAIQ